MGLAILPGRLKTELADLGKAIVDGRDISADEVLSKHAEWINEFLPKYKDVNASNIEKILQDEIGLVFSRVLEDAGVYKRTPEGMKAFEKFVKSL